MTVTLDPVLLIAVDRYVDEHRTEGVDRSGVLNEALRLWNREQRRQAMRAQYLAPRSDEETTEAAGWREIHDAVSADFVRR